MTTRSETRPAWGRDNPLLTLAWFAVLLAVTFTIAFWVGRMVGPAPTEPERAPVAPHSRMEGH